MAIVVQEHKLRGSEVDEASSWAFSKGWKSCWSPAGSGPAGGASGGVAILVRDHLGLHDDEEWSPHRMLSAVVDLPDGSCIALAAVYLISGEGASAGNLALLGTLGDAMGAYLAVTIQAAVSREGRENKKPNLPDNWPAEI